MTQDINILFRKVYNRGDKWYGICASNLPDEDITYHHLRLKMNRLKL